MHDENYRTAIRVEASGEKTIEEITAAINNEDKLPPLVIPGLPLERPENPDKKPRFSGAGCSADGIEK